MEGKMTQKTAIGVGIIGGAGSIGRNAYLPAVLNNPDLCLKLIMDMNEEQLRDVGAECNCDTTTEFNDALKRDDIELLIIASPDQFHCEHTIAAADAGKNIILTKPMAMSVEEGLKIRDAVKRNNVMFMLGTNMRFGTAIQVFKKQLTSRQIGKPVFIKWQTRGDFFTYPKDHFYRLAESGGQMLHNGAHYMDIMAYLADSLPKAVAGVSAKAIRGDDFIGFDNYNNISMEFESGAIGQLEYNQLLVNPRGYSTANIVTVIGTEGMIELDIDSNRGIEIYSKGKLSFPTLASADNSGFNLMLKEFSAAMLNGEASPLPIEHSLRILEACLMSTKACINNINYELSA
jgi:predicted dehydrogenase